MEFHFATVVHANLFTLYGILCPIFTFLSKAPLISANLTERVTVKCRLRKDSNMDV